MSSFIGIPNNGKKVEKFIRTSCWKAFVAGLAFSFGLLFSGGHGLSARAQLPSIVGEASVIDGDTIAVGPLRVRLHGIDAS